MMMAMLVVVCPLEVMAAEDGETLAKSRTATVLPDVSNFKAYSSNKAVVLKWSKVPGATGYRITYTGNGKTGKKTYGQKATSCSIPVAQDKSYSFRIIATGKNGARSQTSALVKGEAVRTMHIRFSFKKTRTLTSHSGGRVKAKFKAGTKKTATGFKKGCYVFKHKGRTYHVTRISTTNNYVSQIRKSKRYDNAEAEYFVNKKGLKSKTSRLIWVNTYTQKLYVFKGGKGKWKCIVGGWEVSTGKASTPTQTGLTKIRQKVLMNEGLPYWSVCSVFSLHGKYPEWTLGTPQSHGCVRNTNEHAQWLYTNCKKGTAVYIF